METETFTYIGVNNNPFTFCLGGQKLDVSSYYLVAPLSLAEVCNLYYNAYSIPIEVAVKLGGTGPLPNFTGELRLEEENPLVYETEPINRLCGTPDSGGYDFLEGDNGFYTCSRYLNTFPNIIAMYNGDVDDEANFLGYGVNGTYAYGFSGGDGGDGLVGKLRVLISFAKYNNLGPPSTGYPNGTPWPNDSEEYAWWLQFTLLGAEYAEEPIIRDLQVENPLGVTFYNFIELYWDYPDSPFEFYQRYFVGEFGSIGAYTYTSTQ